MSETIYPLYDADAEPEAWMPESLAGDLSQIAGRTGGVDRTVIAYERKKANGEFSSPAALEAARDAAMRAQESSKA